MKDEMFKHRMRQLRRGIQGVASRAQSAADGGQGVNVAHRTNVVVSSNHSEPESVRAVSVRQTAPIRQTGRVAQEADGAGESTS